MQTTLADFIKDTEQGKIAESILRKCVHCGFCTATCPTYQLLQDELDGPRGRIYQIKQVLEGTPATPTVQMHLDRCLTCRSCETTCPSGVEYGKLIEIGREVVDKQLPRTGADKFKRQALFKLTTSPKLFHSAYTMGQSVRGFLPKKLQSKVLAQKPLKAVPTQTHTRKMLMLEGCVQPSMSPNINHATLRVLDKLGLELLRPSSAGCCGAIHLHNQMHDDGLNDMRRNIDAWWPAIEAGAEAILINASGCGSTVKEYGFHLQSDARYAAKAQRVSELAKDIVEVLIGETERLQTLFTQAPTQQTLAYHPPCSLQHGQKLGGKVESLLAGLGFPVLLPKDSHLCCGSAGTYSFLQPELSERLRQNKVNNLEALKPQAVLSGNIGCIAHIGSGTDIPVMHWIEYLDQQLGG
ncbi:MULTISPECIES: glycolate oxidase subunit GlcF [Vitreoscilla]|uniref:Glycolate oxidase iron-sulfur subunit n=1 Tax=Vitreoscilla stercoraria TaxID=61 RepID=A0ABY4E812_VITST|nr:MULTISPECIES: glycolate oxidase subunit GlcF [Vitreoscilla]AUZ04389.2 iron-sulfur subunit of glycolate oxidase [Vitreoscilla sp. C1]UOO91885.1 glycolate oxidase subunit GlcF [Vitreoscilla stercoraria]